MADFFEGYNLANIIIILNAIFASLVVFFERKKPETTFTWLLLLFFAPIGGFILYLFLGQDLRKKRTFNLKAEEEELVLRSTRHQYTKINHDILKFKNPETARQKDVILLNISAISLLTQDNTVDIFNDGATLFKDMLEKIEKAQKYIHLQSYIFAYDNLGKKFVELLARKAKEGVEVKLLVDGMGCLRLRRRSLQPILEAGGKIAEFYPPFIPYLNLRIINYRNHRKTLIIDGEYAYIGGFNIADEYIHGNKKLGPWRDTHLLLQGGAVRDLAIRFWLDWSYTQGEDEEKMPPLQHFVCNKKDGDTAVQIVSSGPDSYRTNILDAFLKIIYNARSTVFLQTPYFVPNSSLLSALKLAALSGVDVRLMVPRKPDHWFLYWAAHSYLGELMDCGVKIYFYERGFLHAKVLIADGITSSVGSTNLDIRSFKLNFEVNAFIYDQTVARQLEKQFHEDMHHCTELTMAEYEDRSWGVRFLESFFRLFSPLL